MDAAVAAGLSQFRNSPPADLLAQSGPAAEALEQQLLTRLVTLNHARADSQQHQMEGEAALSAKAPSPAASSWLTHR